MGDRVMIVAGFCHRNIDRDVDKNGGHLDG